LPFGYLSPASIETVLNEKIPPRLSLDSLSCRIAMNWAAQVAALTEEKTLQG
jgi:hypothetical protein